MYMTQINFFPFDKVIILLIITYVYVILQTITLLFIFLAFAIVELSTYILQSEDIWESLISQLWNSVATNLHSDQLLPAYLGIVNKIVKPYEGNKITLL